MFKNMKRVIVILVALLVLLVGVVVFLHMRNNGSYAAARNDMPADGVLTLRQQENGMLLLEWPAGTNTDLYRVTILDPLTGRELYNSGYTKSRTVTFAPPTIQKAVTLRVTSYAVYHDRDDKQQLRAGDNPLSVTASLDAPRLDMMQWIVSPERKLVSVWTDLADNEVCRMYLNGTQQRTIHEKKFSITFGQNDDYPMPEKGSSVTFTFDAYREEPGLLFYGLECRTMTVSRAELLETALRLDYTNLGENLYCFTWNDTRGDYFDIQVRDQMSGDWISLSTIPADWEHSYTVQLDSMRQYQFRIRATSGELVSDMPDAATPDEVTLFTGAAARYCTVWPLKDLQVFEDSELTKPFATVKGGTALCVLESKNGAFRVSVVGGEGYIDSNYCMINLPEYLHGLCLYDITNAYDCLYMVHEYEIPTLTGTVALGYESVKRADGTFLAPLLYPAAKKLETAAMDAIGQGYRLKIYDSYRPRSTTLHIYNVTGSMLDDPLPETTYTGKELTDLKGSVQNYRQLMTDNGRYSLGHFLAYNGSNHNLGIALDLTMVNIYTGEELEMQSSMHDLSWYSELARNNESAQLLSQIMKDAGFGDLESEWWHFQDNESKENLQLAYLDGGVTAQCWMKDDNGWLYRQADGTYLKSCEQTIDGVVYRFDENGYWIEG